MDNGYTLEEPLTLGCPECGGVLRPLANEHVRSYRCHIGHVLTAEAVLAAQFLLLESRLGGCLALLNERTSLCRKLAADAASRGQEPTQYEAAARECLERAQAVRALLESDWIRPAPGFPG
ncbi:MAG TPA: hypothetical protein VH369_00175 [Bryobacteraceae bacterium]|jgi:two-component system chemotaxis response regulator CheB